MGFGRAGHHTGEKSGVSAQRKPCGFVSCDARAPAPLCWAVFYKAPSRGQRAAVGPGLRSRSLGRGKAEKEPIPKAGGPSLQPAGVWCCSARLCPRGELGSACRQDLPWLALSSLLQALEGGCPKSCSLFMQSSFCHPLVPGAAMRGGAHRGPHTWQSGGEGPVGMIYGAPSPGKSTVRTKSLTAGASPRSHPNVCPLGPGKGAAHTGRLRRANPAWGSPLPSKQIHLKTLKAEVKIQVLSLDTARTKAPAAPSLG